VISQQVVPKRKLPGEDSYEVPWREFHGADGFEESFPRNERAYAEGDYGEGAYAWRACAWRAFAWKA
jgi:hypothetical protein